MIHKILEVSIYVLIDLFFNVMLAVIPFRKFLRFGKYKSTILFVLLFGIVTVCRMISLESDEVVAGMLSVFLIVIYLTCYAICFSVSVSRLFFVLLIIINSGSFVAIINSLFISFPLFAANDYVYSLFFSGVYFFILVLTYPWIGHFMNRRVEPLISSGVNNKAWNFLWIVPATFCLSYYYNLFSSGGIVSYTKEWGNIFFIIIFNFCGLYITFLITGLVKESNDFLQSKAEHYLINLQTIQYDYMKNHMEETRRARHDMRQMMAVVQSGLLKNDIDRLREYVDQHIHTALPSDITIQYCENFALNALLVYYGGCAEKRGIEMRAEVDYPEIGTIAEPDMVVLFGNLLENAFEACGRLNERPMSISLVVRLLHDNMVVTVDNTYDGMIKKRGSQILSSKTNGIGIGISSMKRIVEKYHGALNFEYDPNIFKVSLYLKYNIK